MTSTKRPFGLQRSRTRGQASNTMGTTRYRVGASCPSAIANGDPVTRNNAGNLQPATATTDYWLGVAAGFQWVDPTTKRPVWSGYCPAGTSSADSNIWADVHDSSFITYLIQADASVSNGDVGVNYTLSAVGNPDSVTGQSQAVLRVAGRTSATAPVRVIGFSGRADNAQGDAFTIVEVRVLQHEDSRVSAS